MPRDRLDWNWEQRGSNQVGRVFVSLRLRCPHCQNICELTDAQRGTTAACPACKKLFAVPAPITLPPVPPAAPPAESNVTPAPVSSCRLDIGSATNKGKVRERNE